ncbi:Uncharacterised protein [Legionella wadsworthii]|uniref:VirK protein n=1 Tax=Legionella wadsworthii TaxID=28088 RepID=A0A378LPK4_9GAMM|nr:hypothetical protein [Legionella wadsworthii]STY28300.1 Uncharacterised protein [Legionella wadsworthii]
MTNLKYALIASLIVTGAASASPACDGFQIRLKNNLADDLLITSIKLSGADIQPGLIGELKSHSEQVFTIGHTTSDLPMNGEFTLHTISLPTKTVKIKYTLENKSTFCEHTENSSQGDYAVEKSRKIGEVQYSLVNK